MCCLTCSYFEATEPPDHKAAREAGRCEGSCGKKWDWHTIFRYVQNHDEPLKGFCRLTPVRTPVVPWDACAQHHPVVGNYDSWNISAFDADRDHGLVEWAVDQYTRLKRKQYSWEVRRRTYLEEQNSELRQQLTVARKRSASRLARLQKLQKNNKPKPEPKLPEPQQLRLVAAE
jgi:hypothetical protein